MSEVEVSAMVRIVSTRLEIQVTVPLNSVKGRPGGESRCVFRQLEVPAETVVEKVVHSRGTVVSAQTSTS